MGRKHDKREPDGKFVVGEERVLSKEFQTEIEQGLVYELSDDVALVFAKLLSVGVPPIQAVIYCMPVLKETEKGRETAKKVAHQWLHATQVLHALESINGGKWHELPAERRYQLALDKSNAECAFYLWSTNFNSVEHREGVEKIKLARDIIKSVLGQAPDVDDPMAAFARLAIELTRNADASRAAGGKKQPISAAEPMDKLLAAMPKGVS